MWLNKTEIVNRLRGVPMSQSCIFSEQGQVLEKHENKKYFFIYSFLKKIYYLPFVNDRWNGFDPKIHLSVFYNKKGIKFIFSDNKTI